MKTYFVCLVACAGAMIGCSTQQEIAYPYDEPIDSPGQKFGGVPPAVQQTVRAQVGSAEMYDIRKVNREGGRIVYEVYFRDWRRYPPLFVRADGSVLYPDMSVAVGAGTDNIGTMSGGAKSGLKFGDLPMAVGRTVLEKRPTAEVDYIHQITINGINCYEITFKNESLHPKLLIAEDGTPVSRPAY